VEEGSTGEHRGGSIMDGFLKIWQVVNEISCQIQLVYVWLFVIILGLFIWLNSRRGIVLTAFVGAFYVCIWQNFGSIQASVSSAPVLWIAYLAIAMFFIVGVSFSLAWDD